MAIKTKLSNIKRIKQKANQKQLLHGDAQQGK